MNDCTGLVPRTPLPVENRPGLAAVAYRVGTHADFKASLLARIAATTHPALRTLTTRSDDDLAIALCDAWATVADVLTFYQERIANESWLRTATERRSVAELARLIDYAVRPGVAAGTHLVFTLETAPTSPAEAIVPSGTRVMSVPAQGEKPQTFETVAEMDARGAWNELRPQWLQPGSVRTGASGITVVGASTGLRPGDRLLFVGAGRRASAASADWQVRTLTAVAANREDDTTALAWLQPLPALGQPVELFALRRRAPLFGHNAPDPRNLATSTLSHFATEIDATRTTMEWKFTPDGFLYLDGSHADALPERVLLQNAVGQLRLFDASDATALTRAAYALSAPATRLTVAPAAELAHFHGALLRGSVAWFGAERLLVAPVPITEPVASDRLTLVGTAAAALPPGRTIMIVGIDADTLLQTGEVATVRRTEPAGEDTLVLLDAQLHHLYQPAQTRVYGNVAAATHGETVRETLGGGDGSRAWQRLALRQAPLTYVSARTPAGARATLELRVNGLLWHEVRSLYGAAPDDRVYTLRQEEDATIVQFGDGVTGARPPTGAENITATYRRGSGTDGLLQPGQLSLLITRPLGVREVHNPLATDGAAPPESVADTRRNCTLGVHTLDRVVSLRDYEDQARAFAGIAKARAAWAWTGRRRGVFLTVAGTAGLAIGAASKTRADLISMLHELGDPHIPVEVQTYSPAPFGARIGIAVHADAEHDVVFDAVRATLLTAFSFDARSLGQHVTLDEVLAAAQSVDGVVAAHVTRLNRRTDPGVLPRIGAAPAVTAAGAPKGTELLTLDDAALELTDLA